MQNVEFEEEKVYIPQELRPHEDIPELGKFLVNIGLLRTKKQVNIALLFLSGCAFTAAFYFLIRFVF